MSFGTMCTNPPMMRKGHVERHAHLRRIRIATDNRLLPGTCNAICEIRIDVSRLRTITMPVEGRDSDCFDHFVEVSLKTRSNLPRRYLTIRRYHDDAAFQRMADPA